MTDQPILITGATGTQGGAVLRGLIELGIAPLAALVRDPASARAVALESLGVELRVGDLSDVDSLSTAFAGCAAVYAVTTPFQDGVDAEVQQGLDIIAAAERAELPWLLLASVAAADRADVPHFVSKARIEAALTQSDLAWTIIAPSFFYENVSAEDGVLSLALPPDKPLHQVSLANLASVVAAILGRRDEHLGVRVEIAGDDPTPTEMADALGARFEQVPLDEVRARSEDLGAMYTFLSGEGYAIDVTSLRARYPEVPWQSFREWAQRRPGATSPLS